MDPEYFENYAEEVEEKAFWLLVHILHEKEWRSVYEMGTPKVIEMSKQLEKDLEVEAPEILKKIHDLKVTVS